MPSQEISLDETTIAALDRLRGEGESYRDVVRRLAEEQASHGRASRLAEQPTKERSWSDVSGALSEAEANQLEALIQRGRGQFEDTL